MFTVSSYPRSTLRRTGLAAVLFGVLLAGTALGVSSAYAQQRAQMTVSDYGRTRPVSLETNKSMILDLPADVAEVIVSQPSIAGAIMRTARRAIIQGLTAGTTNILFLDAQGTPISVLDLRIAQPASEVGMALQSTLARVIPGSNIRVETLSNNAIDGVTHFVLTGTVLTAEDKTVAEAMASQLSEGDDETGSLIQVIGAQQVMLQVTVSEIRRDVAKQLGINLSGTMTIGGSSIGFNNTMANMASHSVSGGFPLGNVSLNASLQALEDRNALRILAQPTLTAISGQPAEFKAGGQFPIYTSDGNGGQNVTYKDYGVTLNFTPTVKSNGQIGLLVDTGVSELQADKGLSNRSTKTSVELPPGSTLAIGGLLQDNVRQRIQQLPGLGDIPILGALFRSREYISSQTELVIMVTPILVDATFQHQTLPTDRSVTASDAEAIFLGRMETQYGVGSQGGMRGSFNGSVGFVLD